MSATGQPVTITTSPTLIFEVIDGVTYAEKGYTRDANPNIFVASTPNDPVPILMLFPAGTIYLGDSDVAASGPEQGCALSGVPSLSYNCVGGDSLYGIVAASTAIVQLLVFRQ